ncbi:IclR family transcriptional regulator [Streptomyces sp. OE57]|uniref:IclR family transcriptional regulator n=1 Tax=Streptomyces lacaronensis TaxID=3379885 RepID=UPI0039B783D0
MDGEGGPREDSGKANAPAGLIGAVDNVLRLLRLFEDHEMIRVNQVARDMGLSRSTVHRMLATLSHHGFVDQDEVSRAYRPGPKLVDIGLSVVANIDIRAISQDALVRLRDEIGKTAHLACLRGAGVLYLGSVESTRSVRTRSRIGWTLPAHATAIGKALLAELSDKDLAALYPPGELLAPTSRTIRQLDALCTELATVRARGYAINDGESESDVCAVGALVRDRRGRPRAALAVTAPVSRADAGWTERAAVTVARIAKELSECVS